MDTQHLKEAMLAAHTALVEKIGKQPYIPATLKLDNAGFWQAGTAYLDTAMDECLNGPRCDTPEEAIAGLMDTIRAIPCEADLNLMKFQKMVAKVIDFGNDKGIDAQWLNPLVETARALASNALPLGRE